MQDSLKLILKKYEELNIKLLEPVVVSDIKAYTKIAKEINAIKDIAESFHSFLILERSLIEAKNILSNENDEELIDMAKSEITEIESQLPTIENNLKLLLLPSDKNDDKNVIVEIRGAAGGDEANIFAGDLYDIYKSWADINGLKIQILDFSRGDAGGFTQLVFKVEGEKAYSKLKFESGVHRVQRIPATETQGRVHTSTATVTVMPEADETVEIDIKPADLKIDTYRSSGAGGQSVNTTDSAVRITHIPTGVVASSQEGKSQISNRELALKVLKSRLYDIQLQKEKEEAGEYRKLAGSGARSEKIRTYNYPQDRVTDHRISFSTSLKSVVGGKLNILIEALLAEEQAEKIEKAGL